MKPVHHFPFYGNDFFQAVDGYSDAVIVGYLRALWHYWNHLHCSGVPDDDEYMRKICHCDQTVWLRTKGIIFDNERFFKLEDGKWHQGRMKKERDKTISAYNAKVAAAAIARLHNPNNSPVDSSVTITDNKKPSSTLSKLKPEPEPEPYPKPEPKPEPEPYKSGRFAPPSIEELKLQADKLGLPESQWRMFMAYYESNGWKVGKNPMKSWSAALIKWKLTWQQNNNGQATGINRRNPQENPRNVGVCPGVTDYAAASRQIVERQRQERLAKEMAEHENQSPAVAGP